MKSRPYKFLRNENMENDKAPNLSIAPHRSVEDYDKENGTELGRFIDYLNRDKQLNEGESRYFHVGNAGELLNKYGIIGNISIGTPTFGKRHSQIGHNLSVTDWVNVIEGLNNPIAISRYKKGTDSYRVYTPVWIGGQLICAGVDVRTSGKETKVSNISTAFARDIKKIGMGAMEELLYPSSQEELKKVIEEYSAAHNSLLYPQ